MHNKVFELLAPIAKKLDSDGELFIEGMASTNAVDRAGDIISKEAWEKGGLDNFRNNPVILFNHNPNEPIGRATDIEVTENGLRIKARISKAAGKVYDLIKDGVLGAFSVSFLIKDADFIEETYGLMIKDAELLENSVVSIPCNQAATFSLAKSFDSEKEYEDFKKTFTNSVDNPAGLDNANAEDKSSSTANATPAGGESSSQMEIKMDEGTKLAMKELAEKAAREAAADTAKEFKMQQELKEAQEKAAREKEAIEAKAKADAEARTGAERLVEDLEKALKQKDLDVEETLKKYKQDLEEASKELEDMRNSKRVFADRNGTADPKTWIKENGKELMYAHMLGVMTDKGWDTKHGQQLLEKAGIEYATYGADLDQEIQDNIQKEITVYTKVAKLFREITVNGASTVLPIQGDTNMATWQSTATLNANDTFTGNLENNPQKTATTYEAQQVIMNVYRLISSSYLDNDTDEQVLINLMPMLVDGVARAHARAVESALLIDGGSVLGLDTHATVCTGVTPPTALGTCTAAFLLAMRTDMGKYGLNPADLVYIVNQDAYYALLGDAEFENLNEVGAMATKVTGMIGMVYGVPVIVSDEFEAAASTKTFAFCVHTNSYVIPRLRGIKVETDYEVGQQRRIIVASQSLGFTELFAGAPASVKLAYGTIL